MIFWLKFALRSVLRRRRRTLITFISMGLGIAMLIVLGAIMVGVNDTMVQNAVVLQTGHLSIDARPMPLNKALKLEREWEQSARTTSVQSLLPRLTFPAMLRHGGSERSIQAKLVDPKREEQWSPIPKNLRAGQWLSDRPGLVIGAPIADALAVKIGDSIDLITSEQHYQIPISGTFHTGVQALDQSIGYLSITTAQEYDLTTHVQLQTAVFASPGTDLPLLRQQLEQSGIPDGVIATWQEKLPEVTQLVKLNEFSMQIMIVLVIAILAFGVANSLLLSVMDRYRYFGILKAIGVRPREVVVTVVGEALVICLGAGLFGTLLGISISLVGGQIGLDISHYTSYNPHFSINPVIYPRLVASMVLLPQGLALLTGILASIWPALVAARRQVSNSMRDL